MTPIQTIVAIATPKGEGAIGVVRLSGPDAILLADKIFVGVSLKKQNSHTLHFGLIKDGEQEVDEVLVSLFKNPKSYTGEDVVEISAHGSSYILNTIVKICLKEGAQLARAGEFTQRAFLNGKLDLSQAEAVADLIASENKSQHLMAVNQMRGGYSEQIAALRQELIDFAALLELELDFSEEDVAFADREKFLKIIAQTNMVLDHLIDSFQYGNAMKEGIQVAIVGEPNVGKSTLLNALLNEEKAIVSEIAGTTRDFIEDVVTLDGIAFRFIDTAGIRITEDVLESKGIERSFQKLRSAQIVLYLADINKDHKEIVEDFKRLPLEEQEVIVLLNKSDQIVNCNAYDIEESISTLLKRTALEISALEKRNLDKLRNLLLEKSKLGAMQNDGIVVSNLRHLESFQKAKASLKEVEEGLNNERGGELVSIDLRTALEALGSITGEISNEDVLSSIFSRFCIGK